MVTNNLSRKFKRNHYYEIQCECSCDCIYIIKVTGVKRNRLEGRVISTEALKSCKLAVEFRLKYNDKIVFDKFSVGEYKEIDKGRILVELI